MFGSLPWRENTITNQASPHATEEFADMFGVRGVFIEQHPPQR
jgi:hypothetical protein